MRAWLVTLDDETLDATIDLGPRDQFPLATFLLHIVTYTAQQRRDAALILERAGGSPGIDFPPRRGCLERHVRRAHNRGE